MLTNTGAPSAAGHAGSQGQGPRVVMGNTSDGGSVWTQPARQHLLQPDMSTEPTSCYVSSPSVNPDFTADETESYRDGGSFTWSRALRLVPSLLIPHLSTCAPHTCAPCTSNTVQVRMFERHCPLKAFISLSLYINDSLPFGGNLKSQFPLDQFNSHLEKQCTEATNKPIVFRKSAFTELGWFAEVCNINRFLQTPRVFARSFEHHGPCSDIHGGLNHRESAHRGTAGRGPSRPRWEHTI